MAERVHGGPDPRELERYGVDADAIADFSVNLNPYGPCRAIVQAVSGAALDRYPDPEAGSARAAWARTLHCDAAEIAVGHGAADLFWAIARAFFQRGDRVVIAEPTFSELRVAAEVAGANVQRVVAAPARGFSLDFGALALAARGARALYLCSPNNPTGEYLPMAAVRELSRALDDTLVVLDQSFVGLSDHAHEAWAELPGNVLRVRSLTKEFACAGLRIGLCVAQPELIRRIEAARPTWSTSSLALAAIEAAAGEQPFVQASWRRMRGDRDALSELLHARGMRPLPSATSYQLVPLAEPASVLRARLLREGVLVRDCASFGLPEHMRVAALPAPLRARLSRALDVVRSA